MRRKCPPQASLWKDFRWWCGPRGVVRLVAGARGLAGVAVLVLVVCAWAVVFWCWGLAALFSRGRGGALLLHIPP